MENVRIHVLVPARAIQPARSGTMYRTVSASLASLATLPQVVKDKVLQLQMKLVLITMDALRNCHVSLEYVKIHVLVLATEIHSAWSSNMYHSVAATLASLATLTLAVKRKLISVIITIIVMIYWHVSMENVRTHVLVPAMEIRSAKSTAMYLTVAASLASLATLSLAVKSKSPLINVIITVLVITYWHVSMENVRTHVLVPARAIQPARSGTMYRTVTASLASLATLLLAVKDKLIVLAVDDDHQPCTSIDFLLNNIDTSINISTFRVSDVSLPDINGVAADLSNTFSRCFQYRFYGQVSKRRSEPYWECRSVDQCINNNNCDKLMACVNGKCKDPCSGLCSDNATCEVHDHVPYCTCMPGFSGNPIIGCKDIVPGASGQTKFHSSNEQNYDSDGSVDIIERVVDDSSSDNSSESDDEATVIEVPTRSITTARYSHRCLIIGSRPPGKKVYRVERLVKVNFYAAFSHCISHGGRLATVESKDENALIKEEIRKTGIRNYEFWTSGTNLGGDWLWMSSGDKLPEFKDWNIREPNNLGGNEHCLEFYEMDSKGYGWNDKSCDQEVYPICEYFE
ncbi:mannose binding [Homalodisca vitripennis]|nr:mannose binding [Homalodisca vitripennis]